MQKFLTLLAFIIPFQIALSPLSGFDIALIRILITFAFFAFLIHITVTSTLSFTRSSIPLLIAAFLASTLLSSFNAHDYTWFIRKFIFLLNFFVLFFVITGTVRSWAAAAQLLRTALLGGIAAAAIALTLWAAQFIVGADAVMHFWGALIAPLFLGQTFAHTVATYSSAYVNIAGTDYLRAVGFFPDPHVAAFFFEMLVPFALAAAVTAHTRKKRLLWLIGSALLIGATLTTFTRGAYVALFVGALFAVATLLIRARTISVRKLFLTTLGTLGVVGILLFSTPLGARAFSIISNPDSSITQRVLIWRDAANIIIDHPLLGVGLGNYPLTVNPQADYRDPYYAHNLYLDIAAETGIFTALIWIALILTAIARFLRYHPRAHGLAGATSLVILSTHGLFDTMLFSVHTLPLLLIILAASTYAKGSD